MSAKKDATPLQVAAVVSFYMGAALVMVFVNKAVLNVFPDLPLLFLLHQLLLAVILLHGAALVSSKIDIPKFELETARNLFPVVSVNILGLIFNTLCLRGVEASFFQVARGLVLPLTIVVSAVHMRSKPSRRVVVAAVLVTLGFFIGVSPSSLPASSAPSVLSLIYGGLSSLFIALHAVLIKKSLPYCNNSSIQLAYWTNAGSAVILLPFILLGGEVFIFKELVGAANLHVFLWGSLVTGVFGFLLCISAVISIKVTSPITHMFSSAARSVLQTLLGVWLFNDLLTVNRATSILVILIGTMYYTWVKSVENTPPRSAPVTAPVTADLESGKAENGDAAPSFEMKEKDEKR